MTAAVVRLWSDRFWRWLLLVTAGALVFRVVYVLVFKSGDPLLGDAIYYGRQAQEIADGGWFQHPDHPREAADHPPLTALSLAPVALVFPDSIMAERLFNCLLGAATVLVIGLLARRVSGRDTVGLIAAGVAAVYPNLWLNDGLVMSESLTALLVAVFLLVLYRWMDEPSTGGLVVVGLVGGLMTLARAETALLVALAVVVVVLRHTEWSLWERIGRIAVVGGVSLAVLAPWSIYNADRFEEPVLISTNDGLTLLGSNCDTDYYEPSVGLWHINCLPPTSFTADQQVDQSVISREYREAAFEYIGDNQRQLPRVVAARVGRVWGLYRPAETVDITQGEGRELPASLAGLAMYWALIPFAIAGWVTGRRDRDLWPLLATIVVVTVTAALFYGLGRFRIPAEVALVVLAAMGLGELWERVRPEAPAAEELEPAS